ncbi:MAG: hypothetical protein V4469_05345 [Patescibacteria group bacterium]
MKSFLKAVSVVPLGQEVDFATFYKCMRGEFSRPWCKETKAENYKSLFPLNKPELFPQLVWVPELKRFRSVGCIGDMLVFTYTTFLCSQLSGFICMGTDWWKPVNFCRDSTLFTDRHFGVVLQEQA